MTESRTEYRMATTALRSPRTVLLFFADDNWREWARLAIQAASRIWGGGGFIYVPYNIKGEVPESLIPAITAYDPDYVAVMTHDADTWDRISPSALRGHEAQDGMTRQYSDTRVVDDPVGLKAALHVAEFCSLLNYNSPVQLPSPIQHIRSGSNEDPAPFLRVPKEGQPAPYAALAVAPSWPGDIALFAAARTGIAPEDQTGRTPPPDEHMLDWVIEPTSKGAPESLLWFTGIELGDSSRNHRTLFETMSPDLASVRTGYSPDHGAIVVGREAADFALAVAYDRMLGYALWLTPHDVKAHFDGKWMRSQHLEYHLTRVAMHQPVPVVSASLSSGELGVSVALLQSRAPLLVRDEVRPNDSRNVILAERPPVLRMGLSTLAMVEHLGTSVALPVVEEQDGSITAQTSFLTPIPTGLLAPIPLSNFGSPAWIVDISIDPQSMPHGRGIPAKWLLAASDPPASAMLRSSRLGVSFHAASQGFVSAGTFIASQLARPRIRQLGMHAWTQAMAEAGGFVAKYSRPGQRAELIARRLGGRQKLIELTAGPILPFLREFCADMNTSTRSDKSFPAGDGVVLDGVTRYLSIDAFERVVPDLSWQERREFVDQLLAARLMRQGLILDCEECGSVSFLSMDDLGQRFECRRCGAANEFSARRWKSKSEEPRWFYDLHSAVRSLISEHGDVVLLTAARLNSGSSLYADTAEVEFVRLGASQASYEIDLIALTSDGVAVAEAKSNGYLGPRKTRGASIRKRFNAAALLKADKVIFATTAQAWPSEAKDTIESIRAAEFRGIDVELLTALAPIPR